MYHDRNYVKHITQAGSPLISTHHVNERKQSWSTSLCGAREGEALSVEVFTEDPRPEDPGPDPGPVRVRVYILNGQPGPGRVPIYYFGSRVCLTLCVIPESIGEHRTCQ